nr:oxysterol-binding protein 1-like [Lytechinus pictus]
MGNWLMCASCSTMAGDRLWPDDDEKIHPQETDHNEVQTTLRQLTSKLEDLNTCNDLIVKHGAALQRSLSELETTDDPAQASSRLKGINERATLFRITSNAMINVSRTACTFI